MVAFFVYNEMIAIYDHILKHFHHLFLIAPAQFFSV